MKENTNTPINGFSELTEEDPEKQVQLSIWKPFSDATLEQPLYSRCCGSFYFKYRWKILKPLQTRIIFSHYSLGFCIFFVLFLLISVYSIIITWGDTKASAVLPTFFLQLIYLFPAKNSIWLFLTGVSSENFLFWHKYLSVLCVITGLFHAVGRVGPSGILLIILLLLLLVVSSSVIRRRYYDFFLKSHWILFILTIVASFCHKVHLYAAFFWIIDVLLRMYIVHKNQKNMKNLDLEQVAENCIKITIDNEMIKYKPGQLFFICCPKISVFEWHPFNMYSSPFQNQITLYVKVLGDWTKKLYEISKTEKNVKIWLEGPYGSRLLNLDGDDEYQIFLLIGGGIGVAPLNSLCNNLIYENLYGRNLGKIIMVWSSRDQKILESFMDYNLSIWKENLSSLMKKTGVLENFYHFTKKESVGMLKKNKFVELNLGRPNLDEYFLKAQNYAKEMGKTKVAVVCSGPENMMKDVLVLGKKWSKEGIKFDVSVEINEF